MKLTQFHIASHRNGISGAPFHVVTFHYREAGCTHHMGATVFETPGHVAVLDLDATVAGNIAFGEGNSWRGDAFEDALRAAIAQWEASRTAEEGKPCPRS